MWKRNKISFLLVAGSLLLLLLFQIFWLKNIYQTEKENLQAQADRVFLDAVRSVEDSLLIKVWLPSLEGRKEEEVHIAMKMDFDSSGNEMPVWSADKLEGNKTVRTFERKIKKVERDSGVQLSFRSDLRISSEENNFGSIIFAMASGRDSLGIDFLDSLGQSHSNFTLLKKELEQTMPQSGLPLPFEILLLENDKKEYTGLLSNPHTDLVSQETYAIYFPFYKNYLWKKMLSQVLFSIFLFGAILFSFFMVWQSLEKQRRLTELKNDFISNVTHELKTPITTVGVALEAMSNFNALQNPERTKEYLDISKHELQRLSILVDKVLKMSLFEKKAPELKIETVDMQAVVQEVLNSMKLQFEKMNAEVDFQFLGNQFELRGDKVHLTNVVYNLIDNALKYSKSNPVIKLFLENKNQQMRLTVQDQGIGISKDFKEKIFDKFFRVPHGDAHDVKGYGLGLSYVAGVIQKHGGGINVESEPNVGTSFIISLPTKEVRF